MQLYGDFTDGMVKMGCLKLWPQTPKTIYYALLRLWWRSVRSAALDSLFPARLNSATNSHGHTL